MKLADKQSTLQGTQSAEKSFVPKYKGKSLVQNRLRTLLRFLPDPVLAFSLDNKVEYINPEFEKTFGWTLKEVKGKNIKFIPENMIDQTKKRMKQLLKNRSSYNFETQRYTKDGRILDILIMIKNLNAQHLFQIIFLFSPMVEFINAPSAKIFLCTVLK